MSCIQAGGKAQLVKLCKPETPRLDPQHSHRNWGVTVSVNTVLRMQRQYNLWGSLFTWFSLLGNMNLSSSQPRACPMTTFIFFFVQVISTRLNIPRCRVRKCSSLSSYLSSINQSANQPTYLPTSLFVVIHLILIRLSGSWNLTQSS